jgi:hypothetical protein
MARNVGRTGPTTSEGKKRSSENSFKHGVRSTKMIVGDEREEDYRALVEDWYDHYQPGSFAMQVLVDQLADAHWLLLRAQRRYEEAEQGLAKPVEEWDEKEHKSLQLFMRYRTTMENSFNRKMQACERFQKTATETLLKMDARAAHKRDRMEKRMLRIAELADTFVEWNAKNFDGVKVAEFKERTFKRLLDLIQDFAGYDLDEELLRAAVRIAPDANGFGGENQWVERRKRE